MINNFKFEISKNNITYSWIGGTHIKNTETKEYLLLNKSPEKILETTEQINLLVKELLNG